MYASGGVYMMRAFEVGPIIALSHKCLAAARSHKVSHGEAMTWRGVEGLYRTEVQMVRQTCDFRPTFKRDACISSEGGRVAHDERRVVAVIRII